MKILFLASKMFQSKPRWNGILLYFGWKCFCRPKLKAAVGVFEAAKNSVFSAKIVLHITRQNWIDLRCGKRLFFKTIFKIFAGLDTIQQLGSEISRLSCYPKSSTNPCTQTKTNLIDCMPLQVHTISELSKRIVKKTKLNVLPPHLLHNFGLQIQALTML